MPADTVTASIRVDAPPVEVFHYFTDADAMTAWMGQFARLDPRIGGEFAVDIDGAPVRGSYLEVDPPHRLVIAWGFAGSDDLPPGASTLEVTLTPDGDATVVDLVHHGLKGRRAEGHDSGWNRFLPQLQRAIAATRRGA